MDLFGIAGFVGIVGAGVSLVMVNKTRGKIGKQEYYVKAFEVLEQNKTAMDLIGPPITKFRVDLSDAQHNCFEPNFTLMKVPFRGTRRKGNLFVWADKHHSLNNWTIRRLEIIFDDIKDKKVIVYKNPNENETKE